jgi:hypothetical protein
MGLTKAERAQRDRFRSIAASLITRNRTGSTGFRRSLGAFTTPIEALRTGEKFLRWAKREYPSYVFGVSGLEGTGGTHNLRVRAYLRKVVA